MRIAVLRGSPRKNGSSNLLADHFIRGAEEAGHEIADIDVAHADIHPCIGCKACEFSGKPCVLTDEMAEIKAKILSADMVVFVTPLYYFGMSAQLKMCVDRCCAVARQLTQGHLKSALIVSAWNDDDWTMTAIESHYQALCRYIEMEDQGMILGTGCGTAEQTSRSSFPQMAYELGRSLAPDRSGG